MTNKYRLVNSTKKAQLVDETVLKIKKELNIVVPSDVVNKIVHERAKSIRAGISDKTHERFLFNGLGSIRIKKGKTTLNKVKLSRTFYKNVGNYYTKKYIIESFLKGFKYSPSNDGT